MNEDELFEYLEEESKERLIELLKSAYDVMSRGQKDDVFYSIEKKVALKEIVAEELLSDIEYFYQDSLDGDYFAPFSINSKNYMHIPEETNEWFHKIGIFLIKSAKLTEQKEHKFAIKCFEKLYELIDMVDSGEEIVFADELGSWMISEDEKVYAKAFITSLAEVNDVENFVNDVMPLIHNDNYDSFNYLTAIDIASEDQKVSLEREIKAKNIKIRCKS
jgi:hypothetical protein